MAAQPVEQMNNLCSSIEEQLVLGQDRESIDLVNNELLDNLKSQCSFKGNALRVAESLIAAYCRENEELKEENKQLRARLKAVGETKMYALQKELLKSTMRVNQLLQKNMLAEEKIKVLLEAQAQSQGGNIIKQHSLHGDTAIKEQNGLKEQTGLKEELSLYRTESKWGKSNNKPRSQIYSLHEGKKRDQKSIEEPDKYTKQKQDKEVEQREEKEVKQDKGKEAKRGKFSEEQSELKIMQWKLKQKDEEMLLMLKRLKGMEEKYSTLSARLQEKHKRAEDSTDNYSTKKNYVTEFYQ